MRKHNTLWLAWTLFGLWLTGWRQIPGYTIAEKDSNGDVYIAVQLTRVSNV